MAIDPFLLICTLLCLSLHLLLRRRLRSTRRLPPGPTGFPVLGALPLIGRAPHSALAGLAKRYGPIMYLKMGTSGIVVASNPDAARKFLKTLDVQFANRPSVISVKDITYNKQTLVFADYGARWKLLRKLCSLHMLGGKAFSGWSPVRRAEVGQLLHTMHDYSSQRSQPVVLSEVLICAMANVIGQVMLSQRVFDSQGTDSNDFRDMVVDLLTGGGLFNIGDFVPAVAWMDLQGIQRKMRRLHERFDTMVTKLLEEHAASAKEREGRPDVLDLIMANTEDTDGETLSDVNIKGLIFDMFTAGTDTSSIIIEWALAEMLKNPSILKRAQSEIDEVVGRDRRLEESDIPKLPYLRAICKEAFRKHPSTPLSLPHFSFQACEVDGYHIPENTRLLVNIWAIGRDPDVWENPLKFDPERFLSGRGANIEPQGNDFELIPFGAGRRICAGKQAGLVMVHYILGTLVHSFDWKLPECEELNMDEAPGLALPKAVPLRAMVTPRLAPEIYI
ncbi:flavonoid 3',5'-hydroxylase 1 [Elaeis guineensis]|uniref:Flavonoid 3',5'-hydroxylase 1 n=1 Tax=Elaeis guineensis var. tenera TaxID=51953 RepID=A0A6I9R828_ELAGV|nr:flavonoid 3',5'-hydroxylase 1 [Elaeis guineensis]